MPPFQEIEDTFALLEDWEDRFSYMISLGKALPPFNESDKTEENRVRGCASQVWMTFEEKGDSLIIHATSDAILVNGLIAVVLSLMEGKSKQDIKSLDTKAIFSRLGLSSHLTRQRANGLESMLQKIQSVASTP